MSIYPLIQKYIPQLLQTSGAVLVLRSETFHTKYIYKAVTKGKRHAGVFMISLSDVDSHDNINIVYLCMWATDIHAYICLFVWTCLYLAQLFLLFYGIFIYIFI